MNVEDLKSLGVALPNGANQGVFVVDVFTVWCGPCKFVAPILHKLADEGLFKLVQVDLDQNRPLGDKFGITAIPTLLFFKNGNLLDGEITIQGRSLVSNGIMVGAAPEEILRQIVAQL